MKTPKGALILVADGTKARLLTNTGTALDPQLATLLYREEVNPPSRDQGTAAPGRTQSSTGVRRSSYDETDWHDQAEEGFARSMAEELEKAAVDNAGADIIVVAAPRTLGGLRKHYGPSTQQRVVAELGLDLVNHSDHDVTRIVANHEPA